MLVFSLCYKGFEVVCLKMRSGDGFLGGWLLFPYPPFVLLPYSKYGGGSDTLFVLLKVYIQNIPPPPLYQPRRSRRGFFCIPPTLSVRGFIYTVLNFMQTGRSFIKHEGNVDFIMFLLILPI